MNNLYVQHSYSGSFTAGGPSTPDGLTNFLLAPTGILPISRMNASAIANMLFESSTVITDTLYSSIFPYIDDETFLPGGLMISDQGKPIGASIPETIEFVLGVGSQAGQLVQNYVITPINLMLDVGPACMIAYSYQDADSIVPGAKRIVARSFPILWVTNAEFSDQSFVLPPGIASFVGTVTNTGFLIRNTKQNPVPNVFAWAFGPASNQLRYSTDPAFVRFVGNIQMFGTTNWKFSVVANQISGRTPRIGVHFALPRPGRNLDISPAALDVVTKPPGLGSNSVLSVFPYASHTNLGAGFDFARFISTMVTEGDVFPGPLFRAFDSGGNDTIAWDGCYADDPASLVLAMYASYTQDQSAALNPTGSSATKGLSNIAPY